MNSYATWRALVVIERGEYTISKDILGKTFRRRVVLQVRINSRLNIDDSTIRTEGFLLYSLDGHSLEYDRG